MKLENQCCSLELAKKLKELGVKQESLFVWDWSEKGNEQANLIYWEPEKGNSHKVVGGFLYSAFTVAELGEMFPKVENLVTMFFENGRCQIAFQGNVENDEGIATRWGAAGQSIEADTEADARAKMLIYLLENKLITL